MKLALLKLAGFSFLAFAGFLSAQALPPGTGACQSCLVDTSWTITQNTTGVGPATGPAVVITGTNLAPGWAAALAGTKWISSALNQNVDPSAFTCCVGSTTYRVQFTVANPATYGLNISLYADNFATIALNGSPVSYTLEQEYAVLAASFPLAVTKGFVAGTNTLDFQVFNQGGAGGLDVTFTAASSPVTGGLPLGTGVGNEKGPNGSTLVDTNWYVTQDSTGTGDPSTFSNGSGVPSLVSGANLSPGWATAVTGTSWIAPTANQNNSNGKLPATCCVGSTTYEQKFQAGTTPIPFSIFFYADDTASVTLNGKTLYTAGAAQLYQTGVAIPVTAAMINPGVTNTIDFVVNNSAGGSSGLDVSFATATTSTTTTSLGTSTAPGTGSVLANPEPVDASGQYYGTDSEIELGGPMNLGFRRYYSSQLANGGVATAMGTNWMSNFDAVAIITGSTAKVLMFGGKIITFTNSAGAYQLVTPKDISYQFIQNAQKLQFMDPNTGWVYTFTTPGIQASSIIGTLTSIADRNGNTVTITQGANGPTQVSDGLGRTLTFTYTNGQLTQVVDQAARTLSFSYTNGLLTSVTDIYKQTTTYTYTTVGSATALQQHKQLPIGNIPISQTYDAQGRVLTQRVITGNNGNAYTTNMAYDGNGGTAVTDALGNVTKIGSSGAGNVSQLADPTGAITKITYDSSDRRITITDRVGNTTNFTYDPLSGRRASVTDAAGNTTSLTYLAQPQGGFTYYVVSGISFPDGTSITATFDSSGNQLTSTGRKGTTTKYTYDGSGRLTSLTAPNQQTATFTWNGDSTLASSTDALGNKRTYAYDGTKRITSAVDPNGGTSGYVWDKSTTGPMLAIISPVKGESTTIYGDGNREIQDVAISTGGVFHSDYSATGQIQDFIDPLKNKTSYAYDGDDRLSSITTPAGEVVSYAWDAVNRVTSISDAIGPRRTFTYTAESKIATAMDGSGRKSAYSYDAIGRLQGVTTPGGNLYKTAYDKLGNVTSLTNPLGEVETLSRDKAGAVVAATSPGAITTSVIRDAAGHVTSITTPNGNAWTTAYDALERPVKFTDPLGNATTFSFTGAYLAGATTPLGTIAIINDADGRITQRKFSDGTTINAAFDTNGMLISSDGVTIARDAAMRPTSINGIAITLDADSRPATFTYASGKAITYTYDKSGRLATVSDWAGGKTTFVYDGAGRRTSLTYPNGIATSYTYDADGRVLTIAAGSLSSIALTRDAAGKITSANRNVPISPVLQPANQQFNYDAAGQLTLATSDAMGRVTAQNGRKYTWNLASQLTSFVDGSNSATFTYDGLGEMISSTASGVAQTFVFNHLLRFPALSIARQGGSDLRYYVYAPNGTLLYSIEAADNSRHFYHFDEMGNTVMLTNDSGTMTDSYAITPYGENADHIGTTSNPFTWQGQFGVIQEGTGLYFLRSRHYDASAARFISRDSITTGDPRSSEPYIYARGNPLKYVDPLGDLSTDDLKDADGLIQLLAFVATANGPGYVITEENFLRIVVATAVAKTCVGLCASEGHELVNFLYDHNNVTLSQLYTLLAPPIPPPQLGALPGNSVITDSGAPAQTSGPVLGPPHCQTLNECSPGGAAGSLTGVTKVGANGGALIGSSGSTLLGQDGSSLLGQDGSSLLTQDGSSLLTQDGSSSPAAGTLVTHEGGLFKVAPVVSNDGGSLVSDNGSLFKPGGSD